MNKKYTFSLFLFLLSIISAFAQQNNRIVTEQCATMQLLEQKLERNPELKTRFYQQQENFARMLSLRTNQQSSLTNTRQAVSIPVVFHIVLPNPAQVSDAQIQAQLDTLNKDFFGSNGDSVKIPSYFKPLFGKSSIQFCLAQRTPDGNVTTGIERTATTNSSFAADDGVKHKSTGGSESWNPDKYYNVWICTFSGGILGYATFPNVGLPDEQGVVIDYRSLPGGSLANYNNGKTLTHETGHYFNLYHIWGDDNGACTGTDYVDDTPNQGNSTTGCYTGIKTDNCTPTGNGIMYQNYMDYSYDACLVMFTTQQVARMESALSLYRSSLLSSDGCQPVVLKNYDVQLKSITNPAQRICTPMFTPSITVSNRGSQTITALSITTSINDKIVSTTNWTGSIPTLSSKDIVLSNVVVGNGIYSLTIAALQVNGKTDEDISNNTIVQSVQYFDPVTSVAESFEGTSFPPTGWDVVNPDAGITWQRVTGVGRTGSASVMIDNFNGSRIGEKDDLRLPTVNLSSKLDSAFLSFNVAAAAYTPTNTNNNVWDTLEVLVSADCGQTYTSLYKKWGSTLVTRTTNTTTSFTPTANEWRNDSINLSGYIGTSNLLFAFRNTNGFENNIYLDDINLRTVTINPNLKASGFMVTPNPTTGQIAVQFYPQPSGLKGIQILNNVGQRVAEVNITNGGANNLYNFDLSKYASGTYFVRAVFSDNVIVRKIVKL